MMDLNERKIGELKRKKRSDIPSGGAKEMGRGKER